MIYNTPAELFRAYEAERPSQFYRHIYKFTDCGAWVQLHNGKDYISPSDLHKDQDSAEWANTNITGIRFGTIVECGDTEHTGNLLTFPVNSDAIDTELQACEDFATEQWTEADAEEAAEA